MLDIGVSCANIFGSCYDDRHNWHHKYPFDYAASEFGVGKQFNPTKLFIDVCCLLGLASDCKRATGAWAKLKAQRERGDEAQYEGKTDADSMGDELSKKTM